MSHGDDSDGLTIVFNLCKYTLPASTSYDTAILRF